MVKPLISNKDFEYQIKNWGSVLEKIKEKVEEWNERNISVRCKRNVRIEERATTTTEELCSASSNYFDVFRE